ncbi:hypothetical protein Ccrd_025647, partial [Cynara cardunculus var. scolymus]
MLATKSIGKGSFSQRCSVGNTPRRHYETYLLEYELAHDDVDGGVLLIRSGGFGYLGNGRISVVTEDRILVPLRYACKLLLSVSFNYIPRVWDVVHHKGGNVWLDHMDCLLQLKTLLEQQWHNIVLSL